MFSFMKIATFAAIALGTLASAIPSPAPIPVAESGALVERKAAPTCETVLLNLTVSLTVPCLELTRLTSKTATPANVTEIVDEIALLINDTLAVLENVSSLGSSSLNILKLLATIIELVISALGHVFSVCVEKDAIRAILQILDSVLASLISAVLKLIGGIISTLIAQLVGLLGSIIQVILSLKFTACEKVLLLA
ncbi:hypothetical protein PENSPDRAFT_751173 [Peniophora sp. CONT]|nr:hypothetical protein PENSPDRAFT_751173 [Peniophora sp. CONT]